MESVEIYAVSSFPESVNINQLNTEIAENGTLASKFLMFIRSMDTDIYIYFSSSLTASEKTALDTLVAGHVPVTGDNAFQDAALFPHKVLNYGGSDGTLLVSINIYGDANLTNLLYTKTFNYNNELLTSILLTRSSDNAQFLKTLTYSGDTLIKTVVTEV